MYAKVIHKKLYKFGEKHVIASSKKEAQKYADKVKPGEKVELVGGPVAEIE